MSSASPRPEGTPAAPIFSYAQAAKGRTTLSAPSTIQSSQTTTSGINTPAKDSTSVANSPSGGSEKGDRSLNGSYESTTKFDASGDSSLSDSKVLDAANARSSPASPSFGTVSISTLPKEDKDDDFVLVGSTHSDLLRERSSKAGGSAAEKPTESTDGRKGKKSKKQKNVEKEAEKEKEEVKEEVKPEILVPAPIPSVNFWQQRKEELAKTKPSPVLVQSSQSFAEPSTSNDTIGTKPGDVKKRVKTSNVDDGDKAALVKDMSNTGRGQKKGDGAAKGKDDQSNKRAARGGRTGEKDEKSPASQFPPPVEDAMSWPTPETALEEEKRKVQEKLEKDEKEDNQSGKPRPKEKWVTVPYIPSVTFNTPIPTRGGRGRGGARGGRTEGGRPSHTNGSAGGEKGQSTSTALSNEPERRSSRDGPGPRAASLPPTKRGNDSAIRDQRKTAAAQPVEKSRNGPAKSDSSAPTDARYSPAGIQRGFESLQDQQRGENPAFKQDLIQNNIDESYPLAGKDSRKNDSNQRGSDPFKESSTTFNRDSSSQSRERNDARLDRGRGGFRGRGGHNNFPNGQPHPQHIFTNGHAPQPLNGYPIRQSSGPYSPPLPPPPFSNQFAPPPSRGAGRGGSRSQSIPNSSMYGRFAPNGGPIAQQLGPLQTANMFEYTVPQPMSAVGPFPYIDYPSLVAMVTAQLKYYFSIENLCKDVFLRKHMDSQGFVFLNFIFGFKRIQSLTSAIEVFRFACQESEAVDFVVGDDGYDRIRTKEGWKQWVLAIEERDESVRNAGPTQTFRPQLVSIPQNMSQMTMAGHHHSMPPPAFSPNGTEVSFRPFSNGAPAPPVLNGTGATYHPETPLSAAVPDFAPGLLPLNGLDPLEAEVTFQDDEIAHLTMVFTPQRSKDDARPKTAFHNASSRTFSNGSIDGRSIAEELESPRQGRTLTNGSRVAETSPEDLRRSRSPFAQLSSPKSPISNGPPVMWVKGQRQPAPVTEHNSEEMYTTFRARALRNREASNIGETHPDMKLLYEFWSHFLCRNFNLTMYTEFRRYAVEDSREKAMTGMKNLISYYDEILNSKKKVIPETLAEHYVDLVKNEQPGERPGFERLRAAWRNGALDMKSRKKIDKLVDPKLREELERAPHQKSDTS